MSFCFLLYLWMPPQKNMQRGNWLGNGYLFIVNPTHEFCLLKASLNDSASVNVPWCWRWCLWTVKCKHCVKCILMLEIIRCYWFFPKIEWPLTQWDVKCSFFLLFNLTFSYSFRNPMLTINAIESMLLNTLYHDAEP